MAGPAGPVGQCQVRWRVRAAPHACVTLVLSVWGSFTHAISDRPLETPTQKGGSVMAEPTVPRSAADGEASVGDLVSLAVRDVTRLVRYELELARLELRADGRRLFMSVALTATAGFAGILVMFMLSYALAFGLITLGIWNWAAFLIVAGAYVVLGALAMLVVYILLRRVTGLRKTRDTVQEDLAVLRGAEETLVRLPLGFPQRQGQRHPVPHRRGRRGAAGPAAARVPAVLVDLAVAAH